MNLGMYITAALGSLSYGGVRQMIAPIFFLNLGPGKGGETIFRTEWHSSSATFKNQSPLTLDLRGESHGKEFAKNADAKFSIGILYPIEVFSVLYQDSFSICSKHGINGRKKEK